MDSQAIEHECLSASSTKMIDSLIFGYLSRCSYSKTVTSLLEESPFLSQASSQTVQGEPGMVYIPIVPTLHDKYLENIIEDFAEFGRGDLIPEVLEFGDRLRQLASDFSSFTSMPLRNRKSSSENHRKLYGSISRRRAKQPKPSVHAGVSHNTSAEQHSLQRNTFAMQHDMLTVGAPYESVNRGCFNSSYYAEQNDVASNVTVASSQASSPRGGVNTICQPGPMNNELGDHHRLSEFNQGSFVNVDPHQIHCQPSVENTLVCNAQENRTGELSSQDAAFLEEGHSRRKGHPMRYSALIKEKVEKTVPIVNRAPQEMGGQSQDNMKSTSQVSLLSLADDDVSSLDFLYSLPTDDMIDVLHQDMALYDFPDPNVNSMDTCTAADASVCYSDHPDPSLSSLIVPLAEDVCAPIVEQSASVSTASSRSSESGELHTAVPAQTNDKVFFTPMPQYSSGNPTIQTAPSKSRAETLSRHRYPPGKVEVRKLTPTLPIHQRDGLKDVVLHESRNVSTNSSEKRHDRESHGYDHGLFSDDSGCSPVRSGKAQMASRQKQEDSRRAKQKESERQRDRERDKQNRQREREKQSRSKTGSREPRHGDEHKRRVSDDRDRNLDHHNRRGSSSTDGRTSVDRDKDRKPEGCIDRHSDVVSDEKQRRAEQKRRNEEELERKREQERMRREDAMKKKEEETRLRNAELERKRTEEKERIAREKQAEEEERRKADEEEMLRQEMVKIEDNAQIDGYDPEEQRERERENEIALRKERENAEKIRIKDDNKRFRAEEEAERKKLESDKKRKRLYSMMTAEQRQKKDRGSCSTSFKQSTVSVGEFDVLGKISGEMESLKPTRASPPLPTNFARRPSITSSDVARKDSSTMPPLSKFSETLVAKPIQFAKLTRIPKKNQSNANDRSSPLGSSSSILKAPVFASQKKPHPPSQLKVSNGINKPAEDQLQLLLRSKRVTSARLGCIFENAAGKWPDRPHFGERYESLMSSNSPISEKPPATSNLSKYLYSPEHSDVSSYQPAKKAKIDLTRATSKLDMLHNPHPQYETQ